MRPPFDATLTCHAMATAVMAATSSAEQIAEMQARRLTALLTSARRSRLYGAIIGDRDPAALRLADLPIGHKDELMHRFNDWVTEPDLNLKALRAFMAQPARIGEAFRGRFMAWESSGSHGAPGIFVQDAGALAIYDALEFQRRRVPHPLSQWMDPWGIGECKVFIGAVDGHFASTVSIERLRKLNPLMAGSLHRLSFLLPIGRLIDELHRLNPAIVSTYPSVAVMLAEEQLAGRLAIRPKEVWTGGETLTASMRALIADAFGCTVVNSYGASEFISLASECAHGHLHLNSDWAVLEAVDEVGRPVPPGQTGVTTLLTNLANHVQPIIRYDLGDRVAVHDTPCPCGLHMPVITVEGRSGDVLRLGKPGEAPVMVSGLALDSVLEAVPGLTDYQLIQQEGNGLELRTALPLAAASPVLKSARSALRDFLACQGAPEVHIHCHGCQPLHRTRSGKVRRIIALPAPT